MVHKRPKYNQSSMQSTDEDDDEDEVGYDDSQDSDFDPDDFDDSPKKKTHSTRKKRKAPKRQAKKKVSRKDTDTEESSPSAHSSSDSDNEPLANKKSAQQIPDITNIKGPIDFENVIRADIVVNVNFQKYNYNDIMEKVKVGANVPVKGICKVKGKSGKSAKKSEDDLADNAEENETIEEDASKDNSEDKEIGLEKTAMENGADKASTDAEKSLDTSTEALAELKENETMTEFVEKTISNEKNSLVKTNGILNGTEPLANDTNAELINDVAAKDATDIDSAKCVLNENKEEDDDVIVLGELKPEIIVLDD